MQPHRALYAAFDLYPSAKGAATHIFHFATTLFERAGGGLLFVLGNEKMPVYQHENNVEIKRFAASEPNYLKRAEAFAQALFEEAQNHPQLELCHFRDIWGGAALLKPQRTYKTLFEVNGLPSIELPYKYAHISAETFQKIEALEAFCLKESDRIVTPSSVIKDNLLARGLAPEKISVITNGAEKTSQLPKPADAPAEYLMYFGALQTWQGVDVLLKAFAGLQDYDNLKLLICASNRRRYAKNYRKLAEKLGLSERVIWKFQLAKNDLYAYLQHALLSVAPLSECSRNLQQGCSPLKILESMANRTPTVVSDIPPVRELVSPRETAQFVRPDRPAELSRAIRFLIDYPDERKRLAANAYSLFQENFTWEKKKQQLRTLYQSQIKS